MRVYDEEEAAKLNAERWQLDLLNLNPSYVHWGPHEDYMWKEKEGWDGSVINDTWADFGPWTLDEYNECVNFYFSVIRDSKDCPTCGGNGYHPDAQGVVNTFYAHMNERGEHWNDKITQDELEALIEGGRVKAGTTVEEVNAQNRPGTRAIGHDAINRWILTSKNDGQQHFIGGPTLARLYGVDVRQCVFGDVPEYREQAGDVHLRPNYHGNYTLPSNAKVSRSAPLLAQVGSTAGLAGKTV